MAAFLSINKIGKKINKINLLADLSFGLQKGEILFLLENLVLKNPHY